MIIEGNKFFKESRENQNKKFKEMNKSLKERQGKNELNK